MALEGTVTLPAVGTVKKQYVAVAGGLVAAVVGYAYWRRATGAAVVEETGDADFYADTRTGSELPTDAYTNPGGGSQAADDTGVVRAPTTDQEWAQRALETLSWYEPGYVSGIVGKYLARQPLTTSEADIVRQLWGLIGRPPGGNYPIVPVGTTANPVPTNPTTGAPTVPTGFRALQVDKAQTRLGWTATPGASRYEVKRTSAKGWAATLSVSGTSVWISPLFPGTAYKYSIRAIGPGGTSGWSREIQVTTKK